MLQVKGISIDLVIGTNLLIVESASFLLYWLSLLAQIDRLFVDKERPVVDSEGIQKSGEISNFWEDLE
jgi:hypothetical protein